MSETFRAPDGILPEATNQHIADAAKYGKIIIFPTETVYGIGTSALQETGSKRLYALKQRDGAKPLPILLHSVKSLRRWATVSEPAQALAEAFWPGPLTLILQPTEAGKLLLSASTTTVAFRVPDHALTRHLIEASGVPWASSSANMSGEPATADGEAALKQFADRADVIIVAQAGGGTASTVVDASDGRLRILREGALSRASIAAIAAVE
jgi:L-threonylcarbamoyladenylate synthase